MTISPRRSTPALLQIDAILARLTGTSALGEVCRYLRSEFAHYRWVGVYRLDGRELTLLAWDGDQPTAHEKIGIDRGLCGRAARDDRTVRVDDVGSEPEYLSCFPETRSEIVVPIRAAGRVVGEVDVDGTEFKAYDVTDERFLETVAAKIAPALLG